MKASAVAMILTVMFGALASADSPGVSVDNLVTAGDFSGAKPFRVRYAARKQLDYRGDAPANWNFEAGDESISGEFFVSEAPVPGSSALGLKKTEGDLPLRATQNVHLSQGKRYTLAVEYLTTGGGGALRLEVPDSARDKSQSVDIALSDTGGKWKVISVDLDPSVVDGDYRLILQCFAAGAERGIYFKTVTIRAS